MIVELTDIPRLKKVLWVYFMLGYGAAMTGLIFYPSIPRFFGFSGSLVLVIATINFILSIGAFVIARKREPRAGQVQVLGYGTWIWSVMNMILIYKLFWVTTLSGIIFLVVQVLVYAALGRLMVRHLQ